MSLVTTALCFDIINNDTQPIYDYNNDYDNDHNSNLMLDGNNTTSHRKLCCSDNQIVIVTFVVLIAVMVLTGCLISKCPMCRRRTQATGYEDII